MATSKQHPPRLAPIQTGLSSAAALASGTSASGNNNNMLASPSSVYSMTAFNVFTRIGTGLSSSSSRSRPASPVLTTAGMGATAGPSTSRSVGNSPLEYFEEKEDMPLDYFNVPEKRGRRSFSGTTAGISGNFPDNPKIGSSKGKGKGREKETVHHRSYSTSSNPRSAVDHQNYGGITSRPSSSHGNSNSRPSSRPSSRSQSRYRVQSPLLYQHQQSRASSSSTPDSTALRSQNPLIRIAAVLQNTLQCMKRGMGIGTGEWTDLRTGKWRIPVRLKAYVPLLIWVAVSVGMAVVVGVWHEQVFATLDSLSTYLKSQGFFGYFILYLCIFLTTFPPLPLYSTFIFLSGYSFGLLTGFLISYSAALSGAIVVFLMSRRWLKDGMTDLLEKSQGLKKVLRAIERRPKLLFLIRLSPYPYNVMNVLLASSQTLSFSCYTWCTALALPKLLVHVSVGTTIRSFAESSKDSSNTEGGRREEMELERQGQRMKAIAGSVGLALCIGLFIYLLVVARRAVDDLDDSERLPSIDSEDTLRGSPQSRYRPLATQDRRHSMDDSHSYSDMREVGSSSFSHATRPMRNSLALERGEMPSYAGGNKAVNQRHVFQRQDSSMPLFGSGSGRTESTWMKREDKMDKGEDEWGEGLSEVVVGLERAADARMTGRR